jgi:hypothetical protein
MFYKKVLAFLVSVILVVGIVVFGQVSCSKKDVDNLIQQDNNSSGGDTGGSSGDNGSGYTGGGGSGGSSYVYVPPVTTPASTLATPENSASGIDACSDYFDDTKDHWAKKYICFLKSKEIVNGKKDGNFHPEDEITRAEVVKIAVLGFNLPEISVKIPSKIFPDVSSSDWYADFVARAKNFGVVNGRKDGNFDPNNSITRAEAVKILLLSSKISVEGAKFSDEQKAKFSDVEDYAWYYPYIAKVTELNLVSGKKDGKFHPKDKITRAEFSKIAAQLLED